MLLLGIDVGTSSIKVSVVNIDSRQCIASAQYPESEAEIISLHQGWAEQSPDLWWTYVKQAILKVQQNASFNSVNIKAIGISYQMHGLVIVDENNNAIRNSIIWCDSRAVKLGEDAYTALGKTYCNSCLLNSPGNFTASKLAWVKQNEPGLFSITKKMMLPGDYISLKLTGEITTSTSALSEGVLWDFEKDTIANKVLEHYGIDKNLLPAVQPVFSEHGQLLLKVANELNLPPGIPVTYKAGDQPNNALSLNVLKPGEVAATAGTSGVIYAVSDTLFSDARSRVNSFAHVNHTINKKSIGVLLCINGVGILNKWIKNTFGAVNNYAQLNAAAANVSPGSDGLFILPFGNGAERMLENKLVGAHVTHIDLNKHSPAHVYRAGQEGIAFAFRYGLDIMRENGLNPSVIRAGYANMFLSEVFTSSFVNATGVCVELYENDGSVGAALGAGIGANFFSEQNAFTGLNKIKTIEPVKKDVYNDLYEQWKNMLETITSQQG